MRSTLSNFLIRLWKDESGGSSAGRLGIGFVGAGVGFLVGGPFGAAAFGAQLGFLGGSILGNIISPQDLPDIEGARLDPNQTMTSAYGDPIRIGFGRFITGGTVAYYPGFVEHVSEEDVGGKGGPTQTVRSYTYTGSFRVNLCEGPAEAVLKIWANRKLIYDATNTTDPIFDLTRLDVAGALRDPASILPGLIEGTSDNSIRIYLGTEDQFPDPTEQAGKGIDATPAYRGIVSIFFENYPLDDSGGVPPQITALVAMKASEVLLSDVVQTSGGDPTWGWQPGRTSFIIPSATRISNISQSVIATNLAISGVTSFSGIDSAGNIHVVKDGFGAGFAHFEKFSGETLQLLFSSPELKIPESGCVTPLSGSLNWGMGRFFGGVRLPDGTLGNELFYVSRDTLGSTRETIILDTSGAPNPCGGVVNRYFATKIVDEGITIDSERNLWTIANVAGDVELSRIDPGTGDIAETFVLTGRFFTHIAYDRVTNSIVLGDAGSGAFARWGLDSQVIDAEAILQSYDGGKSSMEWWNYDNSKGFMYLQTGSSSGAFKEFDIRNMTVRDRVWTPNGDWGLSSSLVHNGMYDESRHAMVKRHDLSGQIYWLYLDRMVGDLITVKDIVDPISLRAGLLASDIETTNLTQQLHGYLLGGRTQAKSALGPLQQMFFFNPISEDFKIKFPLLGTASVATIPEDDLAAGSGDNPRVDVDRVVEELIQEIELPEVLELGHSNAEAEYQIQYQRAKRPRSTTNSKRQKRLSFPGTFVSNTDAAQRLETLLYNIWTKRRPVIFKTAQRWLRLSPADVVTVINEGQSQEIILGQVDTGADNTIEFSGAADDPTTLVSLATGAEGSLPDQTIASTAAVEFFVLDISLLRDQDDVFGAYLAGAPFGEGTFLGEDILRGTDGTNFAPFHFLSGSRAVDHGFVSGTDILPDETTAFFDRVSSITINLSRGTLPSSTEDAVLDGDNLVLIGKEIVGVVTSVDNGDRTFTISNLLRGRGGTESEAGLHVASEKVIIISANTLLRKSLDLSDLGVPYFYKGVVRGGSINNAIRKLITVEGKSQWRWAPTGFTASITSDDWTINWVHRVRINGSWKNNIGLVGGPVFDYEVDVLSGPGGGVLNTYTTIASSNGSVVTAASHQFFYDDADQVIDFGSVQTTLTVKVYPMSSDVGRGYPTEITLVR